MGIREVDAGDIRALAGPEFSLQTWPEGTLPDFSESGALLAPSLICFSLEACRAFTALPYEQTAFLNLTPKMILLEENAPTEILEEALELGAGDVVRAPLSGARFGATLRKAAEAAALQRDIQNMAREVFVEREILERKNETLSFLVNFLTYVTDSFDEKELLGKAYSCLRQLFPVTTMHAALLTRDDNGAVAADMYIAALPGSPAYDAWRERLLETAREMSPDVPLNPVTTHLALENADSGFALPTDGHILTLPLHTGTDMRFFLMLLTPMERNLGRDQAQALDSALRHMALSLKNARRYQEMSFRADVDGLTGAYNRRFFERTLTDEVIRHTRYRDNLSLLLLDIDFFKRINDSWGHVKGDEVLREVAKTVMGTIRQTDSCIRYGGEEFTVILPHTSARNAAWLAERLRKKIADLSFRGAGEAQFKITVSIGVSSLAPGENKDGPTLTQEADRALYHVKSTGRNRVAVYSQEYSLAASM